MAMFKLNNSDSFMKQIAFLSILYLMSFSGEKQRFSLSQFPEAPNAVDKVFVEKVVDFIIENSDDEFIELPFIYNTPADKIPQDDEETLILLPLLVQKGFTVINWGKGNYPPRGPRIISYTLIKQKCECEVSKIYYNSIAEGLFEPAERLKCKRIP